MQPVTVYNRETSTCGKNTDSYLTVYFPHDSNIKAVVANVLNTTAGVKSWYDYKDDIFDFFLVCYIKNTNPEDVDVKIKSAIEDGFKE
jgi:hypothetical protein